MKLKNNPADNQYILAKYKKTAQVNILESIGRLRPTKWSKHELRHKAKGTKAQK